MVSVFIWKFQGKGVAWGMPRSTWMGVLPPAKCTSATGLRVPAGSAEDQRQFILTSPPKLNARSY